jgi:hypothetical protein
MQSSTPSADGIFGKAGINKKKRVYRVNTRKAQAAHNYQTLGVTGCRTSEVKEGNFAQWTLAFKHRWCWDLGKRKVFSKSITQESPIEHGCWEYVGITHKEGNYFSVPAGQVGGVPLIPNPPHSGHYFKRIGHFRCFIPPVTGYFQHDYPAMWMKVRGTDASVDMSSWTSANPDGS